MARHAVGNVSCFLREQFDADKVQLAECTEGEFFALLVTGGWTR